MPVPPPVGHFCWNELLTADVERSKAFYTELFGWSVDEVDMGEQGKYHLFKTDGQDVAGMMKMPEEAGDTPPHWLSYVQVEDVDASAERAERLGATVHVPPADIPGIGRFSVISDPVGASIALFKGSGA